MLYYYLYAVDDFRAWTRTAHKMIENSVDRRKYTKIAYTECRVRSSLTSAWDLSTLYYYFDY